MQPTPKTTNQPRTSGRSNPPGGGGMKPMPKAPVPGVAPVPATPAPPSATAMRPPVKIPQPPAGNRTSVLVVHPDSRTLRIVRESLDSFKDCAVVTTPDPEYGFELALKSQHDLYIFGLNLPVLHGELLYSLIAKAFSFSHQGTLTAPAVIYVGDSKDAARAAELKQDARVKGVIFRPFKIDRFLNAIGTLIPDKQGN